MEVGKRKAFSTQVIIPALNEEEGIGLTISELKKYLANSSFLIVDGRSTDRTVEIAKEMGAEIVFQDGLGKGDALAKAVESMDGAAEYVILIDADYTYPAEYLPKMMSILEQNPQVGMVWGNRFDDLRGLGQSHDIFYIGNRFIAVVHNLLVGLNLEDPLTGLRVLRAEIIRNWIIKSKGFEVEIELNCYVARSGFDIVEVPIHYRRRLGEKKLKIKDASSILKRIMLETTK